MIARHWRESSHGFFLVLLALTLQACQEAPETGARDVAVRPLNNVGPVYPPAMERLGLEGSVSLDCAITDTGTTADCRVIRSTRPEFAEAALRSVARTHFTPAVRHGVPVRIAHHILNINFTIAHSPIVGLQTLVLHYVCAADTTGIVHNCRNFDDKPGPFLEVATRLVASLHVLPTLSAGRAVPDPARHIDVSILSMPYPGDPRVGLPLSDVQFTLYLKCARVPSGASRCGRVAPADIPAYVSQAGATLIDVGIGVTGIVAPSGPVDTVVPDSPTFEPAAPSDQAVPLPHGTRLG